MNEKYDYDLFVIGAGSGGVRGARIAAGHGAKVAIAEERFFGGTCVNVGCVPKKLMTYAAGYAHAFEDARGYGWDVQAKSHDWQSFIEAKNKEIERLNGIYENLLGNAGVERYWGRAIVTGPHSVRVQDNEITAERILIATGGKISVPDIKGAKEHGITSDDVFYLPRRPSRIVVMGPR